MGYHLWTSPRTGYRRRGTRLAELRAHFEDAITASAIMEPLKSCPLTANAAEMAALLKERDFDVAGVLESELRPVSAYVIQADLAKGGVVKDHLQQLNPAVLIADSTPLAELFSVLGSQRFTFVMVGAEVRGVVTQWDLNKPPVRIYLFGILSLFEMHLDFWIGRELHGRWEAAVKASRLKDARKRLKKRNGAEDEASLLSCLYFADKATIACGAPEVLERLGLPAGVSSQFRACQELRNDLAHVASNLEDGRGWNELNGLVQWIENVLRHSDEEVERLAEVDADGFSEQLWAAN